jgi:putative hydrolase of the HAD superfamily
MPGMEALLAELADGDVRLHALSNYPDWYRWIEAELGLGRYLDWRFVSCRTGVRKPDPEAYVGAARALAVPVDRCLFVDDRESNVRAAREAGMDAIRFEGASRLAEALRERGLPVGFIDADD